MNPDEHSLMGAQNEDTENNKYLDRIVAQAEEIGRLKLRIEQLEQEKNMYAASRQTTPRELSASPVDP